MHLFKLKLKFQNESFAKEAGDLRDAKIKEILNE